MANTKRITVSIMPTYACYRDCRYCYIPEDLRKGGPADPEPLGIDKITERLMEIQNSNDISVQSQLMYGGPKHTKYVINRIELYGGDLGLLKPEYLKKLYDTCSLFANDVHITINDVEKALNCGFKEDYINVSLNECRRDYEQNLKTLREYPNTTALIVVTRDEICQGAEAVLKPLLEMSVTKQVTFIPLSNQNYHEPFQDLLEPGKTIRDAVLNKEYAQFMIDVFEYLHNNDNKIIVTNASEIHDAMDENTRKIKKSVGEPTGPDMDGNIFITPSGNFACVEFLANGGEHFREYAELRSWQKACTDDYFKRQDRCSSCEYFNNCLAEHVKSKTEDITTLLWDDSCNGYPELIEWAKEHKDWI